MEYSIKLVILVVVILIVFAISMLFISNLGKSGEDILSQFYKWLSGNAKF